MAKPAPAAPSSDVEPLVVAVPERTEEAPSFPFVLADDPDHVLVCTRPKMYVLTEVLAAIGAAEKNPLVGGVQIERLLGEVLDAPSAAHLRARLGDSEDNLDLDVLEPIMVTAMQRWYPQGPTGSRSGSRKSRARTGTSSKAKRR